MEQSEPTTVDFNRVLEKLRQDSTSALYLDLAVKQCVIEDQAAMIENLKAKLVEVTTELEGDD